jgi:hypothetical protein
VQDMSVTDASLSHLRDIGARKALLKHVIEIAQNAERIQEGLQALLILGKGAFRMPPGALRFFEGISDHVRDQPAIKLLESLGVLENLIKNDLDTILALSQIDGMDENATAMVANISLGQDIPTLLNEFRRRAQTAVSLRILLRKRGAPVAAMVIPVPESVIEERIGELEKKERLYANRVQAEIVSMQKDIDNLLGNPDYPETAKHELRGVREDLEKNLAHIRSGRKIEDLPVAFEELGVVSANQSDYSSDIFNDSGAPRASTVTEEQYAHENKRRGFLFQLWTWLTTPTSVSWRAAKTWTKNKKQ